MSRRAVAITAAASYVQMASILLTGFLSLSLALRFLDSERVGLWSFVVQSLGYFLLLDFGITNSVGRLMAEPLHSADEKECGRWLSLFLIVTSIQGLAIFVLGYFSADWIIAWFNIPDHLWPEARALWIWMLVLNALTFPLRIQAGILFAQNRNYWPLFCGAAGNWIGLLVFFLFLKAGANTLAYGYSAAFTTFVGCVMPWLAINRGPQRFKISWRRIRWIDLKQLFDFSSGIFVISLVVQVVFFSQSLIITKLLGLAAVTLFTVSSRLGYYGMQMIWRSFDSLNPRWQQLYVAGEREHLAGSFRRYTGLTISLSLLAGALLIALNHPIVNLLNSGGHREGVYAGIGFDALLVLYVLQHTWNHCLAFVPILTKQIRILSGVATLDMLLNIGCSIALAPSMGVNGVLAGSIIGSFVSTIYLISRAPGLLSLGVYQLVGPLFKRWLLMAACVIATFLILWNDVRGTNLWGRIILSLFSVGLFVLLHHADVKDFWQRARNRVAA